MASYYKKRLSASSFYFKRIINEFPENQFTNKSYLMLSVIDLKILIIGLKNYWIKKPGN